MADNLIELVRRVALPHFDRFAAFPLSFEVITPVALEAGDSAHRGDPDRAREFAEIGLASVSGQFGAGIARGLAALAGRAGTA